MKRLVAILLFFTLLLAGCGNSTNIETPPETTPILPTEPPQADDTTEANASSMSMFTVSVPITKSEILDDNGTVIFRDVRQSMQLVMPDYEIADRIIVDFLSRIDQIGANSTEIAAEAQSAYNGTTSWTPYLNSVTYAPMRIDQSVLSLYGTVLQYSGGAHAVYVSRAANYNTVTGDVLTLGSILVDASAHEKLCDLVIDQLENMKDEKYLWPDFADAVYQRFSADESYDEDWYFSNTGLCFYFDHYEIAPYSSGVITVNIPYASLVGLIDDAFFPPEVEDCNGIVSVIAAEDADMTNFTRISEIVVDKESPMHVIYCNDHVRNLQITYSDAQLGGYYTIFLAQSLYASDAIVIQTDPSLFHRLDITYESNNQTVTIPLMSE